MALQRFGGLLIFLCLVITLVVPSGASENNVLEIETHGNGVFKETNKPSNSCVPAHPLPPTLTTECHPYIYSGGGICSDLLGDHLIYGPESKQKRMQKLLANFEFARAYLLAKDDISDKCLRAVELIYCNHYFQRCDNTSSRIRSRPVCREACEIMVQQHCRVEYPRAREINKTSQGRSDYGYFDLINCTILPKRDGGTIPECYFPQEFKENKSREEDSDSCSFGNGQSYRGNISVTQSGHTCQSWSSQCPHRHHRTPNKFPELENAGSACRNPGGQAPLGPWCYTTNPSVRWEYCNVPVCSPEDAKLSAWSAFSACSVSCGGGIRKRTRECTRQRFGGKNCSTIGPLTEQVPCNVHNCSGIAQEDRTRQEMSPTYLGLTLTEIIIVSATGSVLLFVAVVLGVMLFRRHRGRKLKDPDEHDITPYATIHISGIRVGQNVEKNCYGQAGMYENPLITLPFYARIPPRDSPSRLLRKFRNSPYENINQLGRPFANPLEYLFFQPRYENEADDGPCDVLILKPGYDKLRPGIRRKTLENPAPFKRSISGGVDKSGMPVYDSIIQDACGIPVHDSIIREIELACRKIDSTESNLDEIGTILEIDSCDECSQAAETQDSGAEHSDDAVSVQDVDLRCLGTDCDAQLHPLGSSCAKEAGTSCSQAALHMQDQTGLFGFYNSNLTQDHDA